MRLAAVALLVGLLACGHTEKTEASAPAPVVLSLVVYSGRPQPPPETTAVRIGTEVTLRVQGLGPARARVFAPDGTETPTRDTGADQHFTPSSPGKWRIELRDATGVVLAYVDAT